MKLSAASKRASGYPNRDDTWLCTFRYMPAQGLGPEEGVHRRDPSSVIQAGGKYYVWYTKSVGPHIWASQEHNDWKIYPWDYADIWYASSEDGVNWEEQGIAVARGEKGAYDDRTICTPDVMAHDGRYYLVYQSISGSEAYTGGNERVAMSVAGSPDGPWTKLDAQILPPAPESAVFGDEDSYNTGVFEGRVHDPMLFYYRDRYWLYYKCYSRVGDSRITNPRTGGPRKSRYAGRDTRWGVAIADSVEGPYIPSEYNPVTNSGHETLLWKYDGGIAALLNRDGPEANTLQYAEDGINFEIMSVTQFTPQAAGAFRCVDTDSHPLAGLKWGLCHVDERASAWNYIFRFDTVPGPADTFPVDYPPGR